MGLWYDMEDSRIWYEMEVGSEQVNREKRNRLKYEIQCEMEYEDREAERRRIERARAPKASRC